mgnify:CR=1 FL=1
MITILAVGYNRPKPLERLLNCINNAEFYGDKVRLVISLDRADNCDEMKAVADAFEYQHGEKEVILHVISVGDDGGKVILHRIDEEIYAYITDNRHLWDLKEDGTYGYALMGNSNDGYAMITDFSKKGYSEDVFTCEKGTDGEMDTYIVNHELSNAEAFRKAVIQQNGKKSAKWYEFNEENNKCRIQ